MWVGTPFTATVIVQNSRLSRCCDLAKSTSRQFSQLDCRLVVEMRVATRTGISEKGLNTKCFTCNRRGFPETGRVMINKITIISIFTHVKHICSSRSKVSQLTRVDERQFLRSEISRLYKKIINLVTPIKK